MEDKIIFKVGAETSGYEREFVKLYKQSVQLMRQAMKENTQGFQAQADVLREHLDINTKVNQEMNTQRKAQIAQNTLQNRILQGLLSSLFFTQAINNQMNSLLRPAADLFKIFDLFNTMLMVLFLPIMEDVFKVFMKIFNYVTNLNTEQKKFIGYIVVTLAIVFKILSVIIQIALFLKTLSPLILGVSGTAGAGGLLIVFSKVLLIVLAIVAAVKLVIEAVKFLTDIWDVWSNKATNVWTKFGNTAIAVINKVIDGMYYALYPIMRTIELLMGLTGSGFSIRDSVKIPMLGNGGIVTKPTLAVIGEAGPEAVVPLGSGGGMGGSGDTYITVNATVNNDMDIRDLADKLNQYMGSSANRGRY